MCYFLFNCILIKSMIILVKKYGQRQPATNDIGISVLIFFHIRFLNVDISLSSYDDFVAREISISNNANNIIIVIIPNTYILIANNNICILYLNLFKIALTDDVGTFIIILVFHESTPINDLTI